MSWTRTAIDPNVEDLLNRIHNGEPEEDVLAGLPAETQNLVKKLLKTFQGPKPDTLERWLGEPQLEYYKIPKGKTWAAWDDANAILDFLNDQEVIQNAVANQEQFPEFGAFGTPKTAEEAWKLIDQIWEGDPGGRGWHKHIPQGATYMTVDRTKEGEVPNAEFKSGQPPKGTKFVQPGY
jgi:hypothetical protein